MSKSVAARLVSQFVGQDNVLTIPRAVIKLTGDHVSATVLCQLLYWHGKMNGKDFHKTDEDLGYECCASEYQMGRARKTLLKLGVISCVRRGVPARMYYQVNEARFSELLTDQVTEELRSKSPRNSGASSLETEEQVPQETQELYKEQKTTAEDYSKDYAGEAEEKKDVEMMNSSEARSLAMMQGKKDPVLEQRDAKRFFEKLIGKDNFNRQQVQQDFLSFYRSHGERKLELFLKKAFEQDFKVPLYWFIDVCKGTVLAPTEPALTISARRDPARPALKPGDHARTPDGLTRTILDVCPNGMVVFEDDSSPVHQRSLEPVLAAVA